MDVDAKLLPPQAGGRWSRHRARAPARGINPPTERRLAGVLALVVEDDPPSARMLTAVLAAEGAVVRTTGTAGEALSITVDVHPRVIVLDLVLPRVSGLVLAAALRAMGEGRDAAIVAVSSLSDDVVETMARQAGCDAFFAKPIDGGALVDAIARLIGRST